MPGSLEKLMAKTELNANKLTKTLLTTLEHDMDNLQQAINATRGMDG